MSEGVRYALLNTDKNRFIAPYGSTELWSTEEDARREAETYGDHVRVCRIVAVK